MSTGKDRSLPKSMRHKRILDAAADNPNASVDELASHIPTATTELVERILDEYGDPAAPDESVDTADGSGDEKPSSGGTSNSDTETSSESHRDESVQTTAAEPDDRDSPDEPSNTGVTAKQRAVLEYVAMDPSATQREIGDRLGVSAATVSNRVNAIDGFEWSDRKSFVERLFAERSTIRDDAEEQDASPAVKAVDSPEDDAESDPESSGATESTSAEESDSDPAHQPDSANAAVDDDTDQNTTDSETEQRRLDDDSPATVEQLQALESRLGDLEQRIDDESKQTAVDHSVDSSRSVIDDPDLLHKTVQLWLEDERFSKAEEAALLRALFS